MIISFIFVIKGVIFILPCIDKFERVDMRVKAFNVPPQKVQYETTQSPYEMRLYKYTSRTLVTTSMLQLPVHLTIMVYFF